jgi:anaerobic selenocysteine-containing dehydrogenase
MHQQVGSWRGQKSRGGCADVCQMMVMLKSKKKLAFHDGNILGRVYSRAAGIRLIMRTPSESKWLHQPLAKSSRIGMMNHDHRHCHHASSCIMHHWLQISP